MPRVTEEVSISYGVGAGAREEETHKHPAFGAVGVFRTTGGHSTLFGSDFDHHAYMTLRISRNEVHRHLSNDWYHPREEIIEIAMTESQWATLVSSPNVGSGVPCTIQHIMGKQMPGIPKPETRTEQFGREIKATMQKSLDALDETMASIDSMGLPKGKAETLKAQIRGARMQLASNAPFVADQFDEHMEGTVEKAKAEVHGYMTGALMRAGLTHLEGVVLPLAIEPPSADSSGS
jgi:hypothetical protein